MNKLAKILVILSVIYLAWSLCVNVMNFHKRVDSEALIPCLFYLTPLGFIALGIVAAKIIQSTIVIGLVKKVFRRKKKG